MWLWYFGNCWLANRDRPWVSWFSWWYEFFDNMVLLVIVDMPSAIDLGFECWNMILDTMSILIMLEGSKLKWYFILELHFAILRNASDPLALVVTSSRKHGCFPCKFKASSSRSKIFWHIVFDPSLSKCQYIVDMPMTTPEPTTPKPNFNCKCMEVIEVTEPETTHAFKKYLRMCCVTHLGHSLPNQQTDEWQSP